MKSTYALPGLIMLVIGLYFLIDELGWSIPYVELLLTWQSILLGIGLVLMWQGFSNRDDQRLFSGSILAGLGVLFHGVHTLGLWGYEWPYFTLVIGTAFILKYVFGRRDGLGTGLILLAVTAAAIFSARLMPAVENQLGGLLTYWPVIFILLGVYFLFFRRR
ncbi:LiaF transmembrane domain-containing protein [Alkalicoccus luteus]|uniref:LiaF transmembrane domain-containing protein n=1 Tax=Alkalicoccus luteus TaxID=1237094 RepID=A0A969PM54_9BACI|nr:hypothetical protein [Alkalicoccus luteus]NJP36732.1 hypothetical protein [Alkalicoccus luteus]